MEIVLQKGKVTKVYNGLDFDRFQDQTITTKIIKYKSANFTKENALPEEPIVIQDWETTQETILIVKGSNEDIKKLYET
jgi:hypothetical protein